MDHDLSQALQEARHGDLRPQRNARAPAARARLPAGAGALGSALLDRLFQLARPIANASGGGAELALQDAGPFFYLIETLGRVGDPRREDILLVVLDEFAQLTERSYDELYLWCLVQLSRTDVRHVRSFWPQVLELDLRYRAAPWRRPAGTRVFQRPYRLTDLVFFYYVLYTLHGRNMPGAKDGPRSLALCLKELAGAWSPAERALVRAALAELAEEEQRPAYSDALSFLRL